jgi:O-6-methylguanine DNA methyltransferase
LANKALKKIGDVWFGVVLDDSKRIIHCSFSINGKEEVAKNILSDLQSDIQETSKDEFALSVLDGMSSIYEGKETKIKPEFAWGRLPPFFVKALKLTAMIPKGKVATYGGIAAGVGEPKGARAVGNAEASNPFAPFVPCHRVISSSLGLGGYGGGLDIKKAFLVREGVTFVGKRVAEQCIWTPKVE